MIANISPCINTWNKAASMIFDVLNSLVAIRHELISTDNLGDEEPSFGRMEKAEWDKKGRILFY